MVNGGIGDVSTQLTEAFQTAGLPILDGECSLHHQATFYETFWNPEAARRTRSPDGDARSCSRPAGGGLNVTPGGGEFPVAFRDAERSRRSAPTSRATCGPTTEWASAA